MSDAPERGATGDDLWVVDVTAPLAGGRVRDVATDAAARLKLPVEKLVGLLENRIGPVTKPLPQASAARVAEVLHLSGAEVQLRPADADEKATHHPASRQPAPDRGEADERAQAAERADAQRSAEGAEPDTDERRASSHSAADAAQVEREGPDAASREERVAHQRAVEEEQPEAKPPDATPPETTPPDATPPEATPPEPLLPAGAAPRPSTDPVDHAVERFEDASPGEPDADDTPQDVRPVESRPAPTDMSTAPNVGRASREHSADDRASDLFGHREQAPADDAWVRLTHDHDSGDAMLAGWRRSQQAASEPAGASPPSSASEGSSAQQAQRRASTRSDRDRVPIGQRRPMRERLEEEPSSWSYGLRDPFAEAEAGERRARRWALMIALLIASTVFVALQWAYSSTRIDGPSTAGFDGGLVAYRDGAFVSAARAWTPLAEQGDPAAMYMLGWMAEFGQGRPWSNRDAASWYRQAADRGHAPSQLRLADLYRRGLGVDHDVEAALRWYLAAARAGIPRAQRQAALVLAQLDRVDEARGWLAQAASGDPDAAAWWKLVNDAADATNVSP